jgi:hypothetical protein
MKTCDGVALPANPLWIVGCGAVKGSIEELLAEATYVNDDFEFPLYGERAKTRSEFPSELRINPRESKFPFLKGDTFEIIGDGHSSSWCSFEK